MAPSDGTGFLHSVPRYDALPSSGRVDATVDHHSTAMPNCDCRVFVACKLGRQHDGCEVSRLGKFKLRSLATQEYFSDPNVELVGSAPRVKLDELLFLRHCVFFSGVSQLWIVCPGTASDRCARPSLQPGVVVASA